MDNFPVVLGVVAMLVGALLIFVGIGARVLAAIVTQRRHEPR